MKRDAVARDMELRDAILHDTIERGSLVKP
jgi:hypothetical protein